MPKVSRVGVLSNPTTNRTWNTEAQPAAEALGIQLQSLSVDTPDDLEPAFQSAIKQKCDALVVNRNPVTGNRRKQIAELAIKNRIPAIYGESEFVEAGGLVSYGTNIAELFRRSATYADKILKGAKPADLPVEQPTKFELVINLKTAKPIGLTVPPNVLARADRVLK